MRDYEINEAQSRLAYGRATWLVRMIRNLCMRNDLKRLQKFSDYQLRDIGLTRGELNHLSSLPLDTDTTWEAERRTFMNTKYENSGTASLALPVQGGAAPAVLAYPAWKEQKISLNSERRKI